MSLNLGTIIVSFALLASTTYGEAQPEGSSATDINPESPPAKKVDYSKGFSKYYEMGLPNVQGAKYVKLDGMYGSFSGSGRFFYDLKLKGNAWLIEENEGGPSKFVTESSKVIEVYEHDELLEIVQAEHEKEGGEKNEFSRMQMYTRSDPKGRIAGNWKEVDLQRDIGATLEYLREAQNDESKSHMFSYSDAAGAMMLDSIHYHSHGYEDEANEIVEMLFDLSGDRRKVLIQALNLLADNEYDQIMDRFVVHRDFDQMAQELTGLLKQFRVGWKNGLAVKMVLEDVQRRLENPEPSEIEGLSPRAAGLAKRIAQVVDGSDSGLNNYYASLWVLNRSGKGQPGKDEKEQSVFAEIKQGGVKSFPLLLALLDDDYLTKLDSESMGGISRTSFGWNTEMDEEQVKTVYKSMRRPLARGDIAYRFLSKIPLSKERHSYAAERLSRAELATECEQWYAQHKDETPTELACFYLESPGDNQRNAALSFLIANGDEKDMDAVEKILLESDSAYIDLEMLQSYVTARGAEAKDFIERYEESIQTSDSEMYKDENEEQTRETIERLKKIASAPPPEELLEDILAGNRSIAEEREALQRGLARKGVDQTLGMLLNAASETKNARLRSDLISLAATAPNMRYHANPSSWAMGNEDEDESIPDIADHAEIWEEMLGDESALPGVYLEPETVRESTAIAIETLYGRDETYRVYTTRAVLGSRLNDTFQQRAQERLAGKAEHELRELPSADNVDRERVEEIMDRLASSAEDELAEFSESLANDELLAIAKEEFAAELNKRLSPIALEVREVEFQGQPNAEIQKLQEFKGRQLNRAMIEEVEELCREAVAPGKVVQFSVLRKPWLSGTSITFREFDSDTPEFEQSMAYYEDRFEEGVLHLVAGTLRAEDLYAACEWKESETLETEEKDESEGESDNMLDDMLAAEMNEIENEIDKRQKLKKEEFWKAVDQFVAGDCDVWNSGYIHFSGMAKPIEEEKQ